MKTKQLFAIMAVLALGIVAFAGFAPAVDGDDPAPEGVITVTFDGKVVMADVKVLFTAATPEKTVYIATLDAKAVEEMSIISYNAWEAIEPFVDDGYIEITAKQYSELADAKKFDNGVKAFSKGDIKTVVDIPGATEDASFEIYEEGVVALMIAEAKEGTFTQEDIDKAVEDAKKGLYTKEQLDKAVEEAKKSVVVSDDSQTWQIICVILGALLAVVILFGTKALVELKKCGGKLF